MKKERDSQEVVVYQNSQGKISFRGNFKKETIWASLDQIAKLFGRDKSVISRHLKNIFSEEELIQEAVVAKNATTASDGKPIRRKVKHGGPSARRVL